MSPVTKDAVWKPIPRSSQVWALNSRAHTTLYTGARGPGKTDVQLMRFRSRVGKGYGAYWRGVIFDREYKNLDDLVAKSKRWFFAFEDGAKFLESQGTYKWVWPTGEELLFRNIKDEQDYWNFHGQEFPFIGWNELAKYPTLKLFDMMMSCNRSSFIPEEHAPFDAKGERIKVPPIPLEVFATTNPYGAGHNAVKRRFIDPAPYGEVVRKIVNVFNPRTQEREDFETTQVAIFGSYRENVYLSPKYVAELESIADPNQRAAWLHGDWEISSGGALDDVWRRDVHILPRMKVPEGWRIDRAFDWGSTHPFSYGLWAEADGEEAVLQDGTTFCPPPGTLVQVGEWYGTHEIGTNQGLRLSAKDIAIGIREYEASLLDYDWISRLPIPGPADNQIRDVRESESDTIETKMAKEGIRFTPSDKSPGSRRNGLQLIRDRLQASAKREGPGLYFTRNCQASIEILPNLPRDEIKIDDVDTDAEDHPYDMARYRVLKSANRFVTKVDVRLPT